MENDLVDAIILPEVIKVDEKELAEHIARLREILNTRLTLSGIGLTVEQYGEIKFHLGEKPVGTEI